MTSRQLADLMIRRRDLFEPALRSATREIARIAIARSKQLMTEQIYSLPEGRTARGERRFQRFLQTRQQGQTFRPRRGDRKWVRTGHLRRSERVEILNVYSCALVNDAVYAEPRHEAGKPGRRNINPARESHWRDDVVEDLRSAVLELRRQAILKVLRADRGRG
jgi:hypothetical protein